MKRRRLPGCVCPKCGADARAIHLRYRSKGKEMPQPMRTFKCQCCGKGYTFPATDLLPTVGTQNTPNH
jgi:hypothetical protein